jgi:hypothetical protein
VKAILLVPSDAFREALLADGPCGARVPQAWQHNVSTWGVGTCLHTDGDTCCGAPVFPPPGPDFPAMCGAWPSHVDPPFAPSGPPPADWCGERATYEHGVATRALVLAWDGGPLPEGMARLRAVLAAHEGCPYTSDQVVLVNDLYRRKRVWRLVPYVPLSRDRVRWRAPIYCPPEHYEQPWIAVPGLGDADRNAPLAHGLIGAARGLGTVVVVP